MIDLAKLIPRLKTSGRIPLSGVPEGLDAMLLPKLAQHLGNVPLLHVCVDDQRLSTLAEQIAFFQLLHHVFVFGFEVLITSRH